MTKCGRYGLSSFDYSPEKVRASVQDSLVRLKTDYLDTVYLHDVEYVATPVAPKSTGNHTSALNKDKAAYGLEEGEEGTIKGDGDQKILDAFATLQKLKDEGFIKNVGITGINLRQPGLPSCLWFEWLAPGYPLPTLLRLALLIKATTGKPVDVALSYSHLSLQNATFSEFVPHLSQRAQVSQLLAASPLSMGLLTPSPPPWHPAPGPVHEAVVEARKVWAGDLPNLALGFSIRNTGANHGGVPLVVGLSNPREVHEAVKVWREIQKGVGDDARKKGEEQTRDVFREAGVLDWSWSSP